MLTAVINVSLHTINFNSDTRGQNKSHDILRTSATANTFGSPFDQTTTKAIIYL